MFPKDAESLRGESTRRQRLHKQTRRLKFEILMVGTKMVERLRGGGDDGWLCSFETWE